MKLVIFIALVAAALATADDSHYNNKYDNFNIDEVKSNTRLLKQYTLCFIGEGKCPPEGNDLKKLLPEATQTSCAKCTDKQKHISAKFIKAMQEQVPVEYERLYKQMDPESKYLEELKEFLEKYGN